jgi:hypothetical protein
VVKPPLVHDEVEEEKERAEGGLWRVLERREVCRVSALEAPSGTVLERFAAEDADVNDGGADAGSTGNDEAEGKEEEADIGMVKEEAVEANEKADSLVANMQMAALEHKTKWY